MESHTERDLANRYQTNPSSKTDSGGPDRSDYPRDDEIRQAYIPTNGSTVFFSALLDLDPAYNFAQSVGGVIIRQAFHTRFTIRGGRSRQWYLDFGDRLLGVFAERASGDAYVVTDLSYRFWRWSQWSRIEYHTLKNNGDVTSVILVDYTNFANKKVIFSVDQGSEQSYARWRKWCSLSRLIWISRSKSRLVSFGQHFPFSQDSMIPISCDTEKRRESLLEGWFWFSFHFHLVNSQGETIGGNTAADGTGDRATSVDTRLPGVTDFITGNVGYDFVSFA